MAVDNIATLSNNREPIVEAARSGRISPDELSCLADMEATAAFDLEPQPLDVVAHLQQNYRSARRLLQGLVGMPADRLARISADDGYVYAFRPRTSLRRVLDHAIDHMHQVDQWLAWKNDGVTPVPADGWASAADTLDEDLTPISQVDLDAWLWRIDVVMECLIARVKALSSSDLEWQPPDGGWTLWQTLHHLARDRFYASWLADPLPTEPIERFRIGSQRLQDRLTDATLANLTDGFAFIDRGLNLLTRDEIVASVVGAEQRLLSGGRVGCYAAIA